VRDSGRRERTSEGVGAWYVGDCEAVRAFHSKVKWVGTGAPGGFRQTGCELASGSVTKPAGCVGLMVSTMGASRRVEILCGGVGARLQAELSPIQGARTWNHGTFM
jgi:hypothetical protein